MNASFGNTREFESYSTAPHPEQNREPVTFVCWQRPHAISVPGKGRVDAGAAPVGAGGTFMVTFTGQPHPAGTVIPSAAAIPAAWMALNSRTLPGMKKHSIKPRTHGSGVQQKQQ